MVNTEGLKKNFTLHGRLMLLAEALLFITLMVFASRLFGMGDGLKITMAYLVAYLVPRTVVRRDIGWSWVSSAVLLVLAGILVYIDFRRLVHYTLFDGYSLEIPNITGDARSYYKWALHQYDGRLSASNMLFPGYGFLMVGLWKLFGVSVVWPQAMNLMFTLTSVAFTGKLTRRLLSYRVTVAPRYLLMAGLLMSCLLTFYVVVGTLLLKEASVFLGTMMAAYSLSSFASPDKSHTPSCSDIVLFVFACLLLGFVRPTFLYFIVVGVIITTLPHWKRDWRYLLGMLAVVAVSLWLGNLLSHYTFSRHAEIAGGGWNMQRFYVRGDSQRFYHDLLNYYFLYSFWHKILMLPLTMSVQFFIPLPWSYFDTQTFINSFGRFTYGWYFVGGTSLFYFFFLSWRKGEHLGIWPWWPAMAYAAIAYLVAGSVARYVAPILPLFVPIAVYVLCRVYEGYRRKSFLWWWIVLALVITVVLLLCLEIQQGTFSKMLHTQSLVNYWKGLPY